MRAGFLKRKMCALILCAGVSFGLTETASAWGQHGHAVMCEMTYDQLSLKTRRAVDRLMASHPEDERLNTACAWADRAPRKKPIQHYVNFPRDQTQVKGQDCGKAKRCIFTALRDDALRMADSGRSDVERAQAMILLGHWIGDLHQPLHVGFSDDRGGNSIHVKRGPKQGRAKKACAVGQYDLHAVWDNCLVETHAPMTRSIMGLKRKPDVEAHAEIIAARFTETQRDMWAAADVTSWAQESLDIARDAPIQYCALKPKSDFCAYSRTQDEYVKNKELRYDGARSMTVTHAYVDFAAPIAEERLARAAARYAQTLEDVFGN